MTLWPFSKKIAPPLDMLVYGHRGAWLYICMILLILAAAGVNLTQANKPLNLVSTMSLAALTTEQKQKKALSRKFYQLIIRWHFFCGLLFIPLTIIISISGIVYLFEDEYENTFLRTFYS